MVAASSDFVSAHDTGSRDFFDVCPVSDDEQRDAQPKRVTTLMVRNVPLDCTQELCRVAISAPHRWRSQRAAQSRDMSGEQRAALMTKFAAAVPPLDQTQTLKRLGGRQSLPESHAPVEASA